MSEHGHQQHFKITCCGNFYDYEEREGWISDVATIQSMMQLDHQG